MISSIRDRLRAGVRGKNGWCLGRRSKWACESVSKARFWQSWIQTLIRYEGLNGWIGGGRRRTLESLEHLLLAAALPCSSGHHFHPLTKIPCSVLNFSQAHRSVSLPSHLYRSLSSSSLRSPLVNFRSCFYASMAAVLALNFFVFLGVIYSVNWAFLVLDLLHLASNL